jgi:hypothetical protein
MTTDITALDHLVVVNLDIHIWTARKKLVPLDLGGAELPPEDLACQPEESQAGSAQRGLRCRGSFQPA